MKLKFLIGLICLMRPKQWVKNMFVFAPLLFTRGFLEPAFLIKTCIAAALFCVASSIAYIINDIRDIEHDRKHPSKSKTRPLAAKLVSLPAALILICVLSLTLVAGYFVEPKVIWVIIAYLALNLAYSFGLKHQPIIDIFCIALGFVLRVYAGAMAITVPVSSWMFVTTLCLALYLAAIKRRQELLHSGSEGRKVLAHYSVSLVDRYAQMAAIGALLFYSLFVMTAQPKMVITIPFVLYGLFRYWFIVETLEGGESPTDALFSDWQLLCTAIIWIVVCAWSLMH